MIPIFTDEKFPTKNRTKVPPEPLTGTVTSVTTLLPGEAALQAWRNSPPQIDDSTGKTCG
jgi:hypothetical protein